MASKWLKKNKIPSGLYNSWCDLRRRCNNKERADFKNYGGRGINYCFRWRNFENFRQDMGSSWKKGLTLDRIDNNKGYSPANCRWATRKSQCNNTRVNRVITWNNMKKTLSEWAEYLGIKSSTLRQRYYVYKWNIDKCFTYGRN